VSFTLQRAVWDYGPDDPTQHHVLLALADYADDNGGGIWPSIETVAKKCRMSRSSAARGLKGLTADGWIVAKRRGPTSNIYAIQVAKLTPSNVILNEQASDRSSTVTQQDPPRSVKMTSKKYQNDISRSVILIPDPISITDHLTEEEEAHSPAPAIEPVMALREHFVKRTAIQPNDRTGVYDRDWQQPLGQLLALSGGDVAAAAALLDRALAVARGDNERRKTYTVSCPRSLIGIASNLAATQQTAAAVADDDTLWQRAVAAVTRSDYTDGRLKAAIYAIGGTGRIRSANGHDTESLKRSLGHAYRNAAPA